MAKMGRPSKYTEELAVKICVAVATHSVGLDILHKKYDWFPDASTIYAWVFEKPEFSQKYKDAVKHRTDMRALNMAENADNYAEEDYYIDALGNKRLDPAKVAAKKLKLDNDKWLSVKLLPHAYGDKTETTIKVDKLENWLDNIKDVK